MTPDRWRQIEAYYQAACDRGSGALSDAPEDVRRDVERMLAQRSSDAAGSNILDAGLRIDATQTAITPGAMLGPYRIDAPIGQGGMGQVFRATDTRLDRTIAIKTSLTPFDPRFQREAKAIATLNHPNICTLFDVGPNYLVMEFCEGETLEARIRRGKLSIEDTCKTGSQIAAALAAAHARNIVHRDLKPANIMLTRQGVKVLDFGLAKSPTDDTLTQANMIVGTPAYMAPEQRSGGVIDPRTDIYALGLILSEMASGRRLAAGETPTGTNIPPALASAIQRCLAANPNERWQSAEALESVLHWSREEPSTTGMATPVSRRRVAVIALAAVAGLSLAGWYGFRRGGLQPEVPSLHLDIAPPPGTMFRHQFGFAISPDGGKIAFVAQGEGAPKIWVRPLDSAVARPLAGTENAHAPFWSPDSRSIGFFLRGKLQRIDSDGGSPRLICAITNQGNGGAWNSDGLILFNGANDGPLLKVSAEGGAPEAVTTVDSARGENSHRWPVFLPGGRRFIYYIRAGHTVQDTANLEVSGIYTGSLDDPKEKFRVLRTPLSGEYSATRARLLYVNSDGNLVSRLMNADSGRLTDTPLSVTSGMTIRQGWRRADVSISGTGSLVYGKNGAVQWQLTWYDRSGQPVGAVGGPENFDRFRISPDGKRVAVHRDLTGMWDLEFSRGIWTKLSDNVFGPAWSPDGRAILTTSGAPPNLFLTFIDTNRGEQRLTDSRESQIPYDWSGDGRYVLYQAAPNDASSGAKAGLWTLEMAGEHRAALIPSTQLGDYGGVFSPDGRAIAIVSAQSGASEVYVQTFPGAAHRRKVSSNGGTHVRWRRDGKELFYVSNDFKLMAVPMRIVNGEPDPGSPVPLFIFPNHNLTPQAATYDVMPDGQRFLVSVPIGPDIPTLNVITNWRP